MGSHPSPPPPPLSAAAPIGLAPGAPREAAGQDAAKYGSTNPVVTRLLDRWTARLQALIGPVTGTVVDVGVGEGLCLERVLVPGGRPAPHRSGDPSGDRPGDAPAARVVGLEYRFDKATAAGARLPTAAVTVGDAGMLPFPDAAADLVLCIEVLEHLPQVAPAVTELARITRGRCVVSVPYEPWFRLGNLGRGKNLGRLGNDPEHLHAFTPARLRRTLGASFADVRVAPAFPWLMAEARDPRR